MKIGSLLRRIPFKSLLASIAATRPRSACWRRDCQFEAASEGESHAMWAELDDCRSVANKAVQVSSNSVQTEFIISPNVDQIHAMKSGQTDDDFGSLQLIAVQRYGARQPALALERPPKKRLGGRDIPLWRGAGSRQFSHRCRPRDRGKLLMNAKSLAATVLVGIL